MSVEGEYSREITNITRLYLAEAYTQYIVYMHDDDDDDDDGDDDADGGGR